MAGAKEYSAVRSKMVISYSRTRYIVPVEIEVASFHGLLVIIKCHAS
jgi:hypothetical protein